MEFNKIDLKTWNRSAYFEHYYQHVPCTYSMNFKLDITKIKQGPYKLYPVMIYLITKVVNRHKEFRMAFNEQKELGYYSSVDPLYTVFNKASESFTCVNSKYVDDLKTFCDQYEHDVEAYAQDDVFCNQQVNSNVINISMIPWTNFDTINLNLQNGYEYLLPIFTMGKYYHDNERTVLPIIVQVHHSVNDGFHVCKLIDELQSEINKLTF